MESGEFHLEQGLCFKRLDEGKVRIRKYTQPMNKEELPIFEAVIDDSSWASVVASVSARDEDHDTWNEALEYHNKQ